MKNFFLIILIFATFNYGKAQNFNRFSQSEYNSVKKRLFSNAIGAERYLPKNYSKSGNVDYTVYLQKAIDENSNIIMPDFPVLINDSGLTLHSNQKILFQQNSQIILRPTNRDRYGILMLKSIKNVEVYYPNIVGDRDRHLSDSGQWGMGIYIISSSNISVYGANIERCWGDGICIGGRNNISSENISLRNIIINKNRRNGITIGAVKGLIIDKAYISNTVGHSPEAGIDIEPDNNNYLISNVELRNIETFKNGYFGVIISPGNMLGSIQRNISVAIHNFVDTGSKIGLGISVTREVKKGNYPKLTGNISVTNFRSLNNELARIRTYRGVAHSVNVDIDNVSLNLSNAKKEELNRNLKINESYILK